MAYVEFGNCGLQEYNDVAKVAYSGLWIAFAMFMHKYHRQM